MQNPYEEEETMTELSDTKLAECSSCGKAVVYRAALAGSGVNVTAQHVTPNLDCNNPFPKGEVVSGTEEDTVYPPQVVAAGFLVAIPPGNTTDGQDEHGAAITAARTVLNEAGYELAGHYTLNEVELYQLPERVIPVVGVPSGTKYYSLNMPVRAKV
jgi:hypothetical protein